MSVVPITCGYQPYAWGKPGDKSTVAQLVGESDPNKRYAELWIGTHPSKPATLKADSNKTLLQHFADNSTSALGAAHVHAFGKDVPFLLKVLSIDMALSIQAHPTKEHAEELRKRDPAHYPDDNHKPELVVALTDFEALCCFRPLAEVKKFVADHAALQTMLPKSKDLKGESEKEVLRAALADLYGQPETAVKTAIDAHKSALAAKKSEEHSHADRVFLRVESQFPGDVGCWMVYFLNIVNMKPGDGLFMAPNEPHSYLMGDCVEIMAASDNVVRAGLTPKFKDVEVLLDMLTYKTDALAGVAFTNNGQSVQQYCPPDWCTEFSVTAVRLGGATKTADVPTLPSAALGVVVEGSVIVGGTTLTRGQTFLVPAATSTTGSVPVKLADGATSAQVFFGTTRAQDASGSKL